MENKKSAFSYDSLPPAGLKKSIRFLKSLETFPTLWWWLGLSLIIFLIQIAIVSSSFFVGKLIDHLGDSRQFQFYLVMMAVTLAIDNIGRGAILPWIFRSKFTRIATELRVKALDSTLHTPVPRLYQIGTGSIITRLTKDIDNAVLTLGDSGERLVVTLLAFPFTLVSLCIISPFYILPFFLFVLAVYIWSKKIVQFIPLVANRMSDSEARRNAFLLDAIRGLPTTKAMGLDEWSEKRTEKSSWQVVHQWYRSNPSFFWVIRRGYFSYFSLLMMVLGLSLLLAYVGWISVGEASTAVVLIVRLEIRIFMLLEFSAELQRAFTSAGRAIALANLSEDIIQPDGVGLPATLKNPDIVIKDLSFSYPSGAEVLSNLNLNLQGGTTTALVGSSGAGKSTLAVLIAGLQYPTAGSITVGGVNINTEANDAWITSHITLISQEVHLFAGTLREDLHMALPGASDVTLIDALSQAGLDPNGPLWHRWLPQGLDTPVGAGSNELAPEVVQVISLARVLLRNPPVLIMDEATSEAGSEHARLLEAAASKAAHGRTSLVVAHRLDQAREADRILVMESGQIIEDGSHEELINAQGRYAELFSRWQKGDMRH